MNTTSSGSKLPRWGKQLGRRNGADAEAVASPYPEQSPSDASSSVIRIILADSEAIFRVGMSKILALESDLDVVAQTENMTQTLNAVATVPADVVLFEAGLSPTPADAISEVARRALPGAKLILVTPRAGEQETVDYLRRGVRGILARAVSPDLLVRCVRKVAAGETWLDKQGVNWVIEAYRTQALQGTAPKQQLRLSEKEMLIIGGVTQGMKNKDIAREVGTTEQVVKNYLRKIYDKLQVTDRLELALYSMHHRLLDGYVLPNSSGAAAAGTAGRGGEPQAAGSAESDAAPPAEQKSEHNS
ncbi:MAG: response regulator transcription factor [Candidatus Korobacteraceae bacterium]